MTTGAIDRIINGILDREGEGDASKGYLAKNDRGGRTTWGISERAHPELWKKGVPTRADAYQCYACEYVKPWTWVTGDLLAEQLIDCTVLHGLPAAVRLLQEVLNVTVDGKIGEETRRSLDAQPHAIRHIHNALVAYRLKLIDDITDQDARQKVNEEGWENRALSFLS